MTTTTGPHRSRRDHLKGSSSASSSSAPPNRPGSAAVRDREIAARNRQLDHLPDQSQTKRHYASRQRPERKEKQ
jgi:hypothetical protein